jgi:hypothetical protein
MRPANASGVPAAAQKAAATVRLRVEQRRTSIRIGARGHAAKLFLLLFVTGLAVTTRCVHPADAGLTTAAMIAAKRSNGCAIANVSGWLATLKLDGSNAA